MIPLHQTEAGVVFAIRVIPRASRSEIVGIKEDALKLRITAPPVDGKANEECLRVIADFFGVKRRQVSIVGGQTARNKTISIAGATREAITDKLGAVEPANNRQPELPIR